MAKLERLRKQVADLGIIPRREGAAGLPTEVYYLKVKELEALVEDPSLAPGYIEMARLRSKKRRRKKYLKEKAVDDQFGPGEPHSVRLERSLAGTEVKCLGQFTSPERFVSETGYAKAKYGFVYQVDDRRVLLTESEAHRAHVALGVPVSFMDYRGEDLTHLLAASEDRLYRPLMEGS